MIVGSSRQCVGHRRLSTWSIHDTHPERRQDFDPSSLSRIEVAWLHPILEVEVIREHRRVHLKQHVSTSSKGLYDSQKLLFVGRVVELRAGESSRFDHNRMFETSF